MLYRVWLATLLVAALGCTADRQLQKVSVEPTPEVQSPAECRRDSQIGGQLAIADANPRSAVGEKALLTTFILSKGTTGCRTLRAEVGQAFVEQYSSSPSCPGVLLELVTDFHDAGELQPALRLGGLIEEGDG